MSSEVVDAEEGRIGRARRRAFIEVGWEVSPVRPKIWSEGRAGWVVEQFWTGVEFARWQRYHVSSLRCGNLVRRTDGSPGTRAVLV